jgi:hypothetical protein
LVERFTLVVKAVVLLLVIMSWFICAYF